MERFNRTPANMIATYVDDKNQRDCDLWLDLVMFSYQTGFHESTGAMTFLEAMITCAFHYHLEAKPSPSMITTLEGRLVIFFKLAQSNLHLSDKWRNMSIGVPFKVGDKSPFI